MHFVYAQIVHMRGSQLVSQLLLKQSDTLLTQYSALSICVKKFDTKLLFFHKMIDLRTKPYFLVSY